MMYVLGPGASHAAQLRFVNLSFITVWVLLLSVISGLVTSIALNWGGEKYEITTTKVSVREPKDPSLSNVTVACIQFGPSAVFIKASAKDETWTANVRACDSASTNTFEMILENNRETLTLKDGPTQFTLSKIQPGSHLLIHTLEQTNKELWSALNETKKALATLQNNVREVKQHHLDFTLSNHVVWPFLIGKLDLELTHRSFVSAQLFASAKCDPKKKLPQSASVALSHDRGTAGPIMPPRYGTMDMLVTSYPHVNAHNSIEGCYDSGKLTFSVTGASSSEWHSSDCILEGRVMATVLNLC